MRYRILGTAQAIRTDGTPVAVGGARLRALLTVLALRPGHTVAGTALVDEVWGSEPPSDATGALQALVGRLRRAIGASEVRSDGGGYRLCAVAEDIDLFRFERLAKEGARALADDDPAKAVTLLDDALGLWQGPVLADLPDRAFEAGPWEARLLDARRTRLTALLTLGRAEQALPELTALCESHPLDEPLQLLRLRALRDAGRPAEALAAYEKLRRALSSRLGADPGPALRSLHTELLHGSAAAEQPSDGPAKDETDGPAANERRPRSRTSASAANGSSSTGPGSGGRYPRAHTSGGLQSQTAGSPAVGTRPHTPWSSPAGPPPTSVSGNLRARLTSFVGREEEISGIRDVLGRTRLVTLLGPGGAGKTRLSQEAAEGATAPDGVWLAELAPVDDPGSVPEAVVSALGARETVLRGAGAEELRAVSDRYADDPLARLTEYCAPRRMLLILDNCEHVVEAAARLVERLLEHCPALTVLATSREPLGVPGEVVCSVEPLPPPVALRLLGERGAAVRPGFRVTEDEAAAAEICRRLDGLPLAIELAAARLRLLSLRQIADRLDDRFQLLTGGARTVLPRQQTLRAVVDWSWGLLSDGERDVLRRLSVFSGGCELAAAEAVCGEGSRDVLGALGSLVDKSLVVAAPTGHGGMRYRLLETVAEYAARRLDESGERGAAERAHLTYYRELARTTDPELRGPGQPGAIALLAAEYENLRTALRRAVAARDEQEALCLVLSLCWYWQIHDLRHESRVWSRAVAGLGPDPFGEPLHPAAPLYEGCIDAPPPMRPEVLEEARRGVHLLLVACMDMEMEDWQTPEARVKLAAITRVYRPGLPQTCRNPGNLWFYAVVLAGEIDFLREVIDETVHTCRALDYRWELAMALQMRANILANRGDWAGDASQDADESLTIFNGLGDAWGAAEALSARAEAHEGRGDFAAAMADYQAAIAHTERLGARSQVAVLTVRLGNVLIEAGEEARGEELLREVIDTSHTVSNEAVPAGRLFLTMLLGRTGRITEAREQLRLLREGFRAVGFVVFDGLVTGAAAWLDVMDGRYTEGLGHLRQALSRALDPLTRMVAPQMPSIHLAVGAVALVGLDGGARARDAARLMGLARHLLPPHYRPATIERQMAQRVESAARALLGDEEYAAAFAEGGDLSFEEATAML